MRLCGLRRARGACLRLLASLDAYAVADAILSGYRGDNAGGAAENECLEDVPLMTWSIWRPFWVRSRWA